jgi:hypothetical protein
MVFQLNGDVASKRIVGRIEDMVLVQTIPFVVLSMFEFVEEQTLTHAFCAMLKYCEDEAEFVCVPMSALIGPARLVHCCVYTGATPCRYTRRDATNSMGQRNHLKNILHAPQHLTWLWDRHSRL